MARILIVANETIGGAKLMDAVRARHAKGDCPLRAGRGRRNRPSHGQIIYDEAVRDAAQVRVDLAQQFLGAQGIDLVGEVGDEDAFQATMDAIADFQPDEIIVSTHPVTQSGWLRKDLVERIREASGLPVEHVVVDLAQEGLPFTVTLVVANRTAGGHELLEKLKAKAAEEGEHLFIVVVPQEGGLGHHVGQARARLATVLENLRGEGLLVAGMIGDPDPYTAAMNALERFRVSDVIISTLPAEKSGWLRAQPARAHRRRRPHPGRPRRRRGRRRGGQGLMEAAGAAHAQERPRGAPARGAPQLTGRAAAARNAAFHHQRGEDLRRVLHGLLLHPGRERRPVAPRTAPSFRSPSPASTRPSCCPRR